MILAASECISSIIKKFKQHFDTAYLLMACFAIAEDIPNNIIRIMVRNNFETVISSL